MASSSQPKRTSFRTIILAIKQRFVDKEVLPANRILPIARNLVSMPDLQAPQVIFLRPRGFTVDANMVIAGGRYTTMLTRILDVIVRVRMQRDKIGDDTLWLTNEADSYLAIEEAAFDAVQVHSDLTDAQGNLLVCEPIRVVDGTAPDKGNDTTNPGWGMASFGVECKYLANVDISVQ